MGNKPHETKNTFTHLGKTLFLVFRLNFSQSQLYSQHFSPPPGYSYLGSAGGAENKTKQFFSASPSFLLFSCALPQAAVHSGEHMICHKCFLPLRPWCFLCCFLLFFFSFFFCSLLPVTEDHTTKLGRC